MYRENRSKWKIFFHLELESFGEKTVLTSNLNMKDTKTLLKTKDKFLNKVLTIWTEVNFEEQIKSDNYFINQNLWHNSLIRIDKRPLFCLSSILKVSIRLDT